MLTEIIIILDRSGSMASVAGDTIGGFNEFLSKQKTEQGEAKMTLVQFDNLYEKVYEALPLADVKPLDRTTFVPRGSTALLDAIGTTILAQGKRFDEASSKPGKVVVAILTDGEENSSREFTREKVFALIKEQRDKWAWDFYFLGANQDAIRAAGDIGILKAQAITYAANAKGVDAAFDVLNLATTSSREGSTYAVSDHDRSRSI